MKLNVWKHFTGTEAEETTASVSYGDVHRLPSKWSDFLPGNSDMILHLIALIQKRNKIKIK